MWENFLIWLLRPLYRRLAALETNMSDLQTRIDTITQQLKDATAEADTTKAAFDGFVTTVNDRINGLTAANADLQAQIDALKNQNPTLDLTGLTDVANNLKAEEDALAADVSAAKVP